MQSKSKFLTTKTDKLSTVFKKELQNITVTVNVSTIVKAQTSIVMI